VEFVRVEFKAGWDKAITGWQILKTLCAFANDFQNSNGGYIIIGGEESDGRAVLPRSWQQWYDPYKKKFALRFLPSQE